MADCMFHGQSSPGPCGLCEIEAERGEKPGSSGSNYLMGRAWTAEESDRAAGIPPINAKRKKRKRVTR